MTNNALMPIAENMQAKRDNRHFKADVSIDLKKLFWHCWSENINPKT